MKKFRVVGLFTASKAIEVEAESEEDAINKVSDEMYVSLCWSCANEIDLGDCSDMEVEEIES